MGIGNVCVRLFAISWQFWRNAEGIEVSQVFNKTIFVQSKGIPKAGFISAAFQVVVGEYDG